MFNPAFRTRVGIKPLIAFAFVVFVFVGLSTINNTNFFSKTPSGAAVQEVTANTFSTLSWVIIACILLIIIMFIIWCFRRSK